jgi:hypothetical protein
MGKGPNGPIKMKGKKFKFCACSILKSSCPKHSPHLFCPCKKKIKNCNKCRIHIGRCACQKSRSHCSTHGGWSLCPCGSAQNHTRCSTCGSGKKLCEHGKRMNNCRSCLTTAKDSGVDNPYLTSTSEICPCNIPKKYCLEHGGSSP